MSNLVIVIAIRPITKKCISITMETIYCGMISTESPNAIDSLVVAAVHLPCAWLLSFSLVSCSQTLFSSSLIHSRLWNNNWFIAETGRGNSVCQFVSFFLLFFRRVYIRTLPVWYSGCGGFYRICTFFGALFLSLSMCSIEKTDYPFEKFTAARREKKKMPVDLKVQTTPIYYMQYKCCTL